MGITTKFKEFFVDVYKEPIQKKALGQEYGFNGMGFIPIDGVGGYTSLNGYNNAYEKLSIVYKIVNHIAGRVAEAAIEQFEKKKEGKQIDESEFLDNIENPNPFQSKAELFTELSIYDDLQGQFYIWTEKKAIGGGYYFWSLPPQLMTKSGDGYKFGNISIPKDEIYHYRRFVPGYRVDQDPNIYVSPLSVAYADLKVIDYANATSQKQLSKGAVPGAAWIKQQVGEVPIGTTELKQLKDFLVERYTNNQTYGEVPLVGHEIGYTPFGITAKDAMILEQKEVSSEGIANAFGYPLPLLHNKTGGLNSSERTDAMKELLTSVVFPKLEKICGIFTKILEQTERGYRITYDKYSYPEMELDWNIVSQSMERMPFLTWNEKRQIIRYEKLNNALFDEPFIPANITTVEEFENGGMPNAGDSIDNTGDF